jgi:hypothetical protein
MLWLEILRMRMRMLFARGRESDRLDAGLPYHLGRQVAENIANGMAYREASREALRSFGNQALLGDQAREAWSRNWLESLLRALRLGVRTHLRAPRFGTITVLVMALGIGANLYRRQHWVAQGCRGGLRFARMARGMSRSDAAIANGISKEEEQDAVVLPMADSGKNAVPAWTTDRAA